MIICKGKPLYDSFIECLEQLSIDDRGYWIIVNDIDANESYVAFKLDDKGLAITDDTTIKKNMSDYCIEQFNKALDDYDENFGK